MDLAINITSSCRVRVLLVPVPPIKSSTFWKHVELVKKFSVVRLGDVTPDLQNGAGGKRASAGQSRHCRERLEETQTYE